MPNNFSPLSISDAGRGGPSGRRFAPRGQKKENGKGEVQPGEPISSAVVKGATGAERERADEDVEAGRTSAARGEDAAATVRKGEDSLLDGTGNAESALNAAQNGHAAVQPPVGDEIPGRNEHQAGSVVRVLASEQREVHVLADFDAPLPCRSVVGWPLEGEPRRSREQVRLEGGQHVVFLVGSFEAAVGRIETGLVQIGLVLKADQDGDVVIARRLLEDGVGLGQVVALNACDLFRKDDYFGALSSEGGDLAT